MAYPRYISKSAFESGTGALTVGALTGTQAGDIAILFVESANETIATPTGYKVLATQVGTGTAGAAGAVRIASFYRILEDVADTATSVADSGNHTTAIKMLFRDTSLADGAFFVTATSVQATASTAMTFPAVVAATDESLIVLAVALDTDAASTTTVGNVTNASLANITERHDQTVIAGQGGGLAVITGQEATAGSTGTSTATGSTSVTRAYHTISLSRVAPQTTTTSFNQLSTTNYAALSDAMRITAGATGSVRATSSGTFQPDTITNGGYGIETKWYYRQYGTDAWTATAATPSTINAIVVGSALDTVGEFVNDETITGLTNGVEYEFVLFGDRVSATPTNTISFSATASIALSNNGVLNATETGQDTASGTGNVIVTGAFSASESGNDTFTSNGFVTSNFITGSMSAIETVVDTAAANGSVIYNSIASDGSYTDISGIFFVAITDVLPVRTNANGDLFFSGDITYEPQTLTNGGYNVYTIWRYRTVGGSWTDVGTEAAAVQAASVITGVLEQVGVIDATASITTLSADTNYEVQLYARRALASPTNDIAFFTNTQDATVSAVAGAITGTLSATETGADTCVSTGDVIVQGFLNSSESGADTATLAGNVLVQGSLAAAETGSDVATISGIISVSGVTGALAVTEIGNDTAIITGSVFVRGILSSVEIGLDTANVLGAGVVGAITGTVAALETSADTCFSYGFTLAPKPIIEYDIRLFDSMRSSGNLRGAYKSLRGLEHMMWDRVLQKCVYNPNVYVTADDPDTWRIGYGRPITRSFATEEAELKKVRENVWLRSKLTELYKRVVSANPTAELPNVLLSTLYYYHVENQKR